MAQFTTKESTMSSKIWGGRFTKELAPKVKAFNSSLHFDHALYREDIAGSIAHAKMLSAQKLISQKEEAEMCNALLDIQNELESGLHQFNEEHEDIHMFIEHLLIEKIGATGKKLHTGRSRNDQVALDLKLYSRRSVSIILSHLDSLIHLLDILSSRHATAIMPGYTHLQQAQPTSLGKYLDTYACMFRRDMDRFKHSTKSLDLSPLGAAAFAGSNLPLDRHYVARELGFSGIVENTIDAVSDRDYIIEIMSAISISMMHLSRLSEDLIIWSTSEFNFVELDDAFSTGSSLMPNKKNPDVLELLRGKTGRTYGNLMSILTTMKALPLAYNKDMQEDKEVFFDSINTITSSLEVITPLLDSIQFNTQTMADAANSGFLLATECLEKLVLKGVSFRDAHHQVGLLVKEAIEKKLSLHEVLHQHKDE